MKSRFGLVIVLGSQLHSDLSHLRDLQSDGFDIGFDIGAVRISSGFIKPRFDLLIFLSHVDFYYLEWLYFSFQVHLCTVSSAVVVSTVFLTATMMDSRGLAVGASIVSFQFRFQLSLYTWLA